MPAPELDLTSAKYLRAILGRLPGAQDAIAHHLGGDPASRPRADVALVSARVFAAHLQLELEGLRAELRALGQRAADLAAAEREWRPLLMARDRLVLTNGLGTLAELPVAIARLIAQGRAVDAQVQAGERCHQLVRAGTVVATLPRSLAPQLGAVLAAMDWDAWGAAVPVPGRPAVGRPPAGDSGRRAGRAR